MSQIALAHHALVGELARLNHIVDADKLQAGKRIVVPGAGAYPRGSRWGEPARPGQVTFAAPNGPEPVRLVDSHSMVTLHGLHILHSLMSCDYQHTPWHVHPRLALLLAKISDHFGGRTVRIVSGHREVGGYTLPTSRHTMGRAADIQVTGVPRRKVWDYCRSLVQTGCGYYPNSVFLHVDVRAQNAQWVDWSRPGDPPRYGTLRRPYSPEESNNPKRPRVPRRVTRPNEVALTVRVVDNTGAVVRLVDEQPGAASLAALADDLLNARSRPIVRVGQPLARDSQSPPMIAGRL